ncbi:hypothetical protein [Serratia bockelmannii]|uniref:hypothetical protein n=1 Tax=Serratia bockelmannii TaxID=2703793 RepID=UPI00235F2311|nr:hypothetical protein [Serratia bockelmannii]
MTDGLRGVLRPLAAMTVGILPGGLALCLMLGNTVRPGDALAARESALQAQDITVSGRVTAPSCAARLANEDMVFELRSDASRAAPEQHTLQLQLSDCEVEGVGVTLKAEHWAQSPARGLLRTLDTQHLEVTPWYYTVAPGESDSQDPSLPLRLADDTPPLEKDGLDAPARDFSLNQVTYWYDARDTLTAGGTAVIPLTVTVRQVEGQKTASSRDGLGATFTVQLSYR